MVIELVNASDDLVELVLESEERSQWVWVMFPNGDLALATFPQGDTYLDAVTDIDKHFKGE